MKIAITGAGGFLGTELLKQLSQKNDITVYAFTFDFERNKIARILMTNVGTLERKSISEESAESIHVPLFIAAKIPISIAITVPRIVEKITSPMVTGIRSII